MTPRPSVILGRAFALVIALILILGISFVSSAAPSKTLARKVTKPGLPARYPKPLRRYSLQDLPTQRISKEEAAQWLAAATGNPRALAANNVPPPAPQQFFDLTTFPRQPLIGDSTKSLEIHPFWSWDQTTIYFATNRVDADGVVPP
ncbi:MAG TPA: hypothetical protein VFU47_15295, partial [Armatimonadota bacterium]|nr:hypothetical protein [Armatimonadota bacterium]